MNIREIDLKALRKDKNMTQTEAAVAVGVSLTAWQLWERKANGITEENANKLKAVFNLKG